MEQKTEPSMRLTEARDPHHQPLAEESTQDDTDGRPPRELNDDTAEVQTLVQTPSGEYIHHLRPPIGTMFYKEDLATIANNVDIYAAYTPPPHIPIGYRKVGTVTWRANIHTYVIGAKPDDPDFEKHNGSILIVVVHSGSVQVVLKDDWSKYLECTQTIKCPTPVAPKVQLPPSNSGTQTRPGEPWHYNISFNETLPMFNNDGNGTFNFDAKYARDFSVKGGQQSETELADGWKFASKYSVESGQTRSHVIAGLSVFTAKVPEASYKFRFCFSLNQENPEIMYIDEVDREIIVDVNLGEKRKGQT
ncbi:hypothetical protein AB1N83_009404 [Pleurotus pulmonarius]